MCTTSAPRKKGKTVANNCDTNTSDEDARVAQRGLASRGAALMALTVCLQPANQAIGKFLAPEFPVIEIVWGRFLFHSLFALPFVLAGYGLGGLRAANLGTQIVRGGVLVASTALLFAALTYIPMADAIALMFVAPLIVTALSPVVLGEHVGPRRWLAVVIGFAGALIIISPGATTIEWASLLALGSAAAYAFYLLITRRMAGTAPLAVTLVYTALVGTVITSAVLPFIWVTPTPTAWALMVFSGAISALAHLCLIRAYDYAQASLIAPIAYGEIVMATLLGYVVFGDLPGSATWLGVAVIVGAGIYITHRGNRRAG